MYFLEGEEAIQMKGEILGGEIVRKAVIENNQEMIGIDADQTRIAVRVVSPLRMTEIRERVVKLPRKKKRRDRKKGGLLPKSPALYHQGSWLNIQIQLSKLKEEEDDL